MICFLRMMEAVVLCAFWSS
uniref:Uncharacterized protein n=1 Tax=Arundo donax TaxID=35708 RepID=A0A0A9FEZ6_ARUDO